jgi:hypothetical protein
VLPSPEGEGYSIGKAADTMKGEVMPGEQLKTVIPIRVLSRVILMIS